VCVCVNEEKTHRLTCCQVGKSFDKSFCFRQRLKAVTFVFVSCRRCLLINNIMWWHLSVLGLRGVYAIWRFVCTDCLPRMRDQTEFQQWQWLRCHCQRVVISMASLHVLPPRTDASTDASVDPLQFANGVIIQPQTGSY